jgi:nitric oxide synthase oxygenase domain/subunit
MNPFNLRLHNALCFGRSAAVWLLLWCCRNAPKCSNRKFWEELRLVDGRHATSPAEMFEVCLEVGEAEAELQ